MEVMLNKIPVSIRTMIKNKTRFTSASFPPVTVNLSIKREQVYPFRDLNTDFSVKSVQKLKNRYL